MTDPDTEFEIGVAALTRRDPIQAVRSFDRAEAFGANADACAAQRWYCWMLLGDFESAWRECDAIAGRNTSVENCFWDGREFDGKCVIVRSLHGYGDAIQFIRYLPLLKTRARRVVVETHPDLVSLFRGQPGVDAAISWIDTANSVGEDWEQQIELMELPRAFRTTLCSIPSNVPYLKVPEGTMRRVAQRLDHKDGYKVGLVWGAGDWDRSRSLPLENLTAILQVPQVNFFSFQHGSYRSDLSRLQQICPIHDTAGYCSQIINTAAALTNMDLLITVDTMAAHLGGALGVNVWTLLQWQADWRWMLDREESPWYPTMRLFRQPEPENWSDAVAVVASELHRVSAAVSER